jgi:hypothetical protein
MNMRGMLQLNYLIIGSYDEVMSSAGLFNERTLSLGAFVVALWVTVRCYLRTTISSGSGIIRTARHADAHVRLSVLFLLTE